VIVAVRITELLLSLAATRGIGHGDALFMQARGEAIRLRIVRVTRRHTTPGVAPQFTRPGHFSHIFSVSATWALLTHLLRRI